MVLKKKMNAKSGGFYNKPSFLNLLVSFCFSGVNENWGHLDPWHASRGWCVRVTVEVAEASSWGVPL